MAHRRYSEKDIAWISFIKRLKATGMPIKEIKKYAGLRAEGDATLSERMDDIEFTLHCMLSLYLMNGGISNGTHKKIHIKKYAVLRAKGDVTLSERMEMLIQHRQSLNEQISRLQAQSMYPQPRDL